MHGMGALVEIDADSVGSSPVLEDRRREKGAARLGKLCLRRARCERSQARVDRGADYRSIGYENETKSACWSDGKGYCGAATLTCVMLLARKRGPDLGAIASHILPLRLILLERD